MSKLKTYLIPLFSLLLLNACFSSGGNTQREWQKNPVDEYVKALSTEPTYSIILYDMDVQGNFVKSYLHQYQIITMGADSVPLVETTDWLQVSEDYFTAHENDMGMEIVAKGEDGKVTKSASPAGFTNYVGNERYGRWRTDNSGNSFWEFYGKYRLLSDVFYMVGSPVYRRGYYDYRDNYRGRRSYYGGNTSSGNPRYGTNSDYNRQTRPNFFQRRAAKNGFTRSTRTTSSARSTRSSSNNRTSRSSRSSSSSRSRTSRSSGRYSRSSSRSRGGGFGK